MALDPDLEGFLELAQLSRLSGKSRPLQDFGVERARHEFEQTSQVLDSAPPAGVSVQTLSIPCRDGQAMPARLYRDENASDGASPVVLYLHGGGYVVGSLDSHDAVCRRLAAVSGHAVLAPAYRLAPEHPFPTAVHDSLDAANWLAEQGPSLEIDTGAVFFAGDSVGATLATVLAITAVEQPQALALKPRGQLLFYPVTDASRERNSHTQYDEGYLLETDTLRWFYRHYAGQTEARHDWRMSPLLAHPHRPIAPALVSLAQYDPLHDEGLAYAEHLRTLGTEVTLNVEAGLTHDFLRMGGITERAHAIYAAVAAWLAEHR